MAGRVDPAKDKYLTMAHGDVRFLPGSECRMHCFILQTVNGMLIMLVFNAQTWVLNMIPGTSLSSLAPTWLIHHSWKVLNPWMGIFCVLAPVTFYKSFQLQELINWIQVWWIWRQMDQFYFLIGAHLWNPFGEVQYCIIYSQNRLRLWPSSTMVKKLFDKAFKVGVHAMRVGYNPQG